jgi:hypothetical protein
MTDRSTAPPASCSAVNCLVRYVAWLAIYPESIWLEGVVVRYVRSVCSSREIRFDVAPIPTASAETALADRRADAAWLATDAAALDVARAWAAA